MSSLGTLLPGYRMASRLCLALLLCVACAIDIVSEDILREATKLKPTSSRAHMELVAWYLGWNETAKALGALRDALEADTAHAWQYHERMGDLLYDNVRDLESSEKSYKAALDSNPNARRALLRYGSLRLWRGGREEADKLFASAAAAGILRDARQRPLEFREDIPAIGVDQGFWVEESSYPLLSRLAKRLASLAPKALEEYTKWSTARPQDGEPSGDVAVDPQSTGRRVQFWIHQPRWERGVWRSQCSLKTPFTCNDLRSTNASGLSVLRASFEVLEPGAAIRPSCHYTNSELFVDVALHVPPSISGEAFTIAGGKNRTWKALGDVQAFDASFEHSEVNAAKDAVVLLRVVVRHPDLPCDLGSSLFWAFANCGWKGLLQQGFKRLSGLVAHDGAEGNASSTSDVFDEF